MTNSEKGKKDRKSNFLLISVSWEFLPVHPIHLDFYPAISVAVTWRGVSENLIFCISRKEVWNNAIKTLWEMILNLESYINLNTIWNENKIKTCKLHKIQKVYHIYFLWYWGLNSRPSPWATPPAQFFEIGSYKLFAWAGFELWSFWSLPAE
jgi:hypothetical protein